MAVINRSSDSILEILNHKQRPSIFNSGSRNVGDAITNLLNRTDPYQREQLILRTLQKLESLFQVAKSWNSTLLQQLGGNNQFDKDDSYLSNQEKVSEQKCDVVSLDMVVHGGIIPVIATLGIILIVVGVYGFLSGPRRKQIYTLLLSNLLIFDGIFLIFELLKNMEMYLFSLSIRYRALFHVIMNSAIRVSAIASIFMLVTISHVRLCAIRKPFHHNSNMLSWREKRNICAKYCFPIIIISIILTIPVFFEFEFSTETNQETDSIISPSSMRLHVLYSVLYVGILNFGILGVVPTVYLTYVVYQIRSELKKSNTMLGQFESRRRTRRRVTSNTNDDGVNEEQGVQSFASIGVNRRNSKFEKEMKGLREMTRGILVFVVLHIFRIVTTFGEFYVLFDSNKDDEAIKMGYGMPRWLEISASISELCMVTNSFLDGMIYSDLGLKTKLRNPFYRGGHYLRSFINRNHSNHAIVVDDAIEVEIEKKDQTCRNEDVEEIDISRELLNCDDKHSVPSIVIDDEFVVDIEEKEELCQNDNPNHLGAHKRLGISKSLTTKMASAYITCVSGASKVDLRRFSMGYEGKYSYSSLIAHESVALNMEGEEQIRQNDDTKCPRSHVHLGSSKSLTARMSSSLVSRVSGLGKVDMRRSWLSCDLKHGKLG